MVVEQNENHANFRMGEIISYKLRGENLREVMSEEALFPTNIDLFSQFTMIMSHKCHGQTFLLNIPKCCVQY